MSKHAFRPIHAVACSLALAALGACATTTPVNPLPAITVAANGETAPVGTAAEDAADDPAIWRNSANPAQSLIVATDKKAGVYVYGLDGKVRSFLPGGLLNNVDLLTLADGTVLVVASDRNDPANARLQIYRLDPTSAELTALGSAQAGAGEGYGICLADLGGKIFAYSVLKNGGVHQVRIDVRSNYASGEIVRSMKLATQPEGCVADARTASLYVGEESVGIWRFDARDDGGTNGALVARTDGKHLVADVEGLALAPEGADGGWLIASSQGDNAYALYRLPGMVPEGRFRIGGGAIGSTEETDGIALGLGDFGPEYPEGLFVAQDGVNAPAAQNFKLVSWSAVREALNLAD